MPGRRRYFFSTCFCAVNPVQQDKGWHRDKLFHIHSSTSADIPSGMAYAKGRIAVSSCSSVKVWMMIKGILTFHL